MALAVLAEATGRVCTGFSYPLVAKYAESSGTISYTDGQELARGVSVELNVETVSADPFYANNIVAESEAERFSSGTATLTVDGLLSAAEKLILGLAAETDSWLDYNDDQQVPYVGIGYIAEYVSGDVTFYVPYVLTKARFAQPSMSHSTREDARNYQTQELTATLYRGDDAKHTWLSEGSEFATEAAALAALKTKLGITDPATT